MTCTDCRSLLLTTGTSELAASEPARLHLDSCVDCASAALDLAIATRRVAAAFDDVSPGQDPVVLAQVARAGGPRSRSRFRSVGRLVAVGLAVAVATGMCIAALEELGPAARRLFVATSSYEVQTIPLKCLSVRQARTLAEPYLISFAGSLPQVPEGVRALSVRAPRNEIEAIQSMVARFDGRCELPDATPTAAAAPLAPPAELPREGTPTAAPTAEPTMAPVPNGGLVASPVRAKPE